MGRKCFIGGMSIGFLAVLVGILMGNNTTILGLGVLVMGLVTIMFPLCTPDTVKVLGDKKAKLLGRFLGIVLAVVGVWIWKS